ncbi:acylphosphatase [Mesorhizobium amorphae]|uniref:acylphosphatase n=1 Tax=Mesorhizobium amorphae TaxID=71433 RepID=UPI001782BE38|nr:acylphosphatase [Mesorhizobium amorphae]
MNDRQRAVQARVYGRVQGVSYRVWARSEATQLGLTGWVRNEIDGSVTARMAGTEAAVSSMVQRLWIGPAGASVTRVDVEELSSWNAPTSFTIVV